LRAALTIFVLIIGAGSEAFTMMAAGGKLNICPSGFGLPFPHAFVLFVHAHENIIPARLSEGLQKIVPVS